ncbi:sugar ABC transporter permease [Planctomycetota bacterium]|nr:sugar ABC transporter permease [Planctomycetota bacterium]
MTRFERKELLKGLLFIGPWIFGFLVFTGYPLIASLYYSFTDYDILSDPVWIGGMNYVDMYHDEVFWKALINTLKFSAFAIPLGLVVSLLVAVMLNQQIIGRPVFRTIYFLPSLVPIIASAMIWMWLFNGQHGLINFGLEKIGIDGPNWLNDAKWAMPSLILMSLWGVGNQIVIYLAALQDVPRHLYESAELDGANGLQKLLHVTMPMISPVIYFNMVMGIIGSIQVFVQPYIMFANGGPDRSALFYAVYLFDNAFSYLNMGYACAMAWVMFLIVLGLTLLATQVTKRFVHYAGA